MLGSVIVFVIVSYFIEKNDIRIEFQVFFFFFFSGHRSIKDRIKVWYSWDWKKR